MNKKTNQNIKWRGIKTNPIPRFEDQPVTIINRLKQKSLHLPRIDDKKRWSGFPGLAGTGRKIASLSPKDCVTIVEPFAGSAKVTQELLKMIEFNHVQKVVNDTSQFLYSWLNKELPDVIVTNEDFVDCIKRWDTPDTHFVIDGPWVRNFYDQTFSSFNRESVIKYDEEILQLVKQIKGTFFITTRKENSRMLKSGYRNYLVKSVYELSGHFPLVMITTNMDFGKNKLVTKEQIKLGKEKILI